MGQLSISLFQYIIENSIHGLEKIKKDVTKRKFYFIVIFPYMKYVARKGSLLVVSENLSIGYLKLCFRYKKSMRKEII